MMRPAHAAALGLLLAISGCGSKDRAPYAVGAAYDGKSSGGAGAGDGLIHTVPPPPPPPDAGGLCGNQIIPLILDHPNLYFVLDASGSMNDAMDRPNARGILLSKYAAARGAIAEVLRTVGHRVSYGAAIFPGDPDASGDLSCPPGAEVFPTQPGDPVAWAISGNDGPVLTSLLNTLARRAPSGLTPTAASIEALKGTLLGLKGKTYAFLLTDGAPNCDLSRGCTVDGCTINIEARAAGFPGCTDDPTLNCCDPKYGAYDYRWCLDGDPTVAAVSELASGGVQTYVIGMPGTAAYQGLLDRLAIAGGTARPTEPQYYPVDGSDDLATTLQQIGLSVTISCDVKLEQVPPDPSSVRVYFDQTMIHLDPQNGWTWASDDTIRMVGSSCDQLKAGDVVQVQVVANCPAQTM